MGTNYRHQIHFGQKRWPMSRRVHGGQSNGLPVQTGGRRAGGRRLLVGFPLALFRRSVWLLSGVIYDASYYVLGSTAPIVSGAGAFAAVSNWSHLCPACYEWVGVLPVVCASQPQQHRCKRQGLHISRSLGWSGAATAKAPSFLPGMAGLSLFDEVRPLLCSSTLRSLEKLLTSLASGWLNFLFSPWLWLRVGRMRALKRLLQ